MTMICIIEADGDLWNLELVGILCNIKWVEPQFKTLTHPSGVDAKSI